MTPRIHPTHAKTSLKAMLSILAVSVMPFAYSFYAAYQLNDESLETISIAVLMMMWIFVMLIGALRMYVAKCPTCNRWMHRRAKQLSAPETIHFTCEKCRIDWDSTIAKSD
ncbi:hypothetical protein HC024_05935 [Methylococcaceae bacterium WWC4]|nr:hypothetical protein [Methylococcaceae bacterium WWC4]